jgi:pectate lyase
MRAAEAESLITTVRAYADRVLRAGRGRWGERNSALFVDALDVATDEPPRWLHPADGRELILSNLANQQDLLRLLVGLSALTDEPRYADAARAAVAEAFARVTDEGGLLYWGGHAAFDLTTGTPFTMDGFHELKSHYPFYDLLWSVDAAATRRLIEAFWNRHILDWGNLDMNRHGAFGPATPVPAPWSRSQELAPVFFVGEGLSFKNTGSDLFFAAACLGRLAGDPGPLGWAARLVRRYQETRDPQSGLTGYQYSQIAGDRAALQFGPEFGDRAREHTLLDRTRAERIYGTAAICQLGLAETTGGALGEQLLACTRDELLAFARHAYDPERNLLSAVLRDGTRLLPADVRRPGYYVPENFAPYAPGSLMFWAYAKALCLTEEARFEPVVAAMARGLGLGELFRGGAAEPTLRGDACTLLGLLELHRRHGGERFLAAATTVGQAILRDRWAQGMFVEDPQQRFARLGAAEPLALLHLAAALRGADVALVPAQYSGKKYFTAHWWRKGRTSDYLEWF